MSQSEQFMDAAATLLADIRRTQLGRINQAAKLIADSFAGGGALHYFDSGHCTNELLHRAGGLLAINHIQVNLAVNEPLPAAHKLHPQPPRDVLEQRRLDESTLPYIVGNCHFRPGDALLIHSVSGASWLPVGLALGAKAKGVKVVAITSYAYSAAVPARNSAGKKLYEVADVAIDNCGVVGDAALEIEGLDAKACPTSGLAFVFISWSLIAQVLEELLARGLKPHVWRSVNLPDPGDFNDLAQKEYERTGI